MRERDGDQHEGDGPPAESNAHGVGPRRCGADGERARRISCRRQQHREEGEGRATQHRRQVDDRREEGCLLAVAPHGDRHDRQAGSDRQRDEQPDRVRTEVAEDGGTDGDGGPQAHQRQRGQEIGSQASDAPSPFVQVTADTEREIVGAVGRERRERHHAAGHGVPVEDPGLLSRAEVGPQRQEERPVRVQRNAADHVAERGAEEDRQQQAGDHEDRVAGLGEGIVAEVGPQLEPQRAPDQQPQHHHERQVEPAEAGGVERREREVERSARGQQPDFVRVPDRSDAAADQRAFFGGPRDPLVDGAHAQVEAFGASVAGARATEGIFLAADSGLKAIALSGADAPGVQNGTFVEFDAPVLNNRDEIAFVGTVRRGRETLQVLYLYSGGVLRKLVAGGDPAPARRQLRPLRSSGHQQ